MRPAVADPRTIEASRLVDVSKRQNDWIDGPFGTGSERRILARRSAIGKIPLTLRGQTRLVAQRLPSSSPCGKFPSWLDTERPLHKDLGCSNH